MATDLVIHKDFANSPTEHIASVGTLTFESQDIDLIGKLMFDGDYMLLYDKSGNLLASEPIEEIRKIVFETPSNPTFVETVKTNPILVYPNPAQDVIFIHGIEAQPLRVFNIEGKMIQEVNGNQVSVSHLSIGTYILQIGTQAVRFIKQ
jgi:hypothetical protein